MSTRYTVAQAHEDINNIREDMREMNSKIDQLIAMMSAQAQTPTGKGKKEAPKQPVEFIRADGSKTMAKSQKQADAWAAARDRREESKAAYEAAHATYKPSAELIAAIKENRAAVTRTVAKEKYGFVGTREELKALKAKVLA